MIGLDLGQDVSKIIYKKVRFWSLARILAQVVGHIQIYGQQDTYKRISEGRFVRQKSVSETDVTDHCYMDEGIESSE